MKIKNLIFHAIILSTIAGAIWLGVWQLQRREWKHQLIQTYQAAQNATPFKLQGQINEKQLWKKFQISGTVNYDQAILLPTYIQAEDKICGLTGWGFRLIVPLKLNNGQTLLYQDGFIPSVMKKTLPHGLYSGHLTVSVWPLRAPSWLPPQNNPTHQQWLVLDQSLYDAWYIPRHNIYLNSEFDGTLGNGDGSVECDYPVNYWRRPELPDNHLQYAITWFALAAMLSGYYIYFQWKLRRSP